MKRNVELIEKWSTRAGDAESGDSSRFGMDKNELEERIRSGTEEMIQSPFESVCAVLAIVYGYQHHLLFRCRHGSLAFALAHRETQLFQLPWWERWNRAHRMVLHLFKLEAAKNDVALFYCPRRKFVLALAGIVRLFYCWVPILFLNSFGILFLI